MTPETITDTGTFNLIVVCFTIMIIVVVPCLAWLINSGKIRVFSWKRGEGLTVEATDSNEIALAFQDKLNDDALDDFKRTLISDSYECFKDNPQGQKHATYIAALNHCLRDITRVGLDSYIANASQKGKWSEAEAQHFVRSLLLASRTMIDKRLDAYEKCLQFGVSDSFRKITRKKHEKNMEYSKMINNYLDRYGMGSETITKGHENRSNIIT